ncbi:dihydroxy-acid dehydratase [Pseudooceanicola sediminis]|uniref:Dihydroxy-acid dehydratase n=1 Tax=Pseudooceanicola sediminis TaxID=2211117 RepID=A0A399IY17_9RHOB|nr:dihydroxy-acid dehydratase [Pseudooceanicola sediminis]KAA2314965.1 dihydroxy-acid dehydratase [Puniceibacterium sp. HSS470]RII37337.1 dihydroxy-acid dehydratase [Pseudooceanicola sediminis]|tara:strand:+ start:14095 stop:15792 length:1698 start_codon:yes stop_codon:yes gene_type:complete
MSDTPKNSRALRSNFGIGSSFWAVRRAQWRALGLSDDDMTRPKIAVINTSSELAICFSHLDHIAERVKQSIRDAGGLPFEVRTAAPSDFIHSAGSAGRYILPTRDLITNDIEVQVEGAQLDGMVCLASCDKTGPGQLMAAARLNIPTIFVICGYQDSGEVDGQHVDIEDVFLGAGHHAMGAISLDRLTAMSENAIRSPGVCSGMGTANSMHSVIEALGMSLPGTAPVRASGTKMLDNAAEAGRRIVDMVWEDLRPRDILTEAAFENAVKTVFALSASINTVKHLQAVATEAQSGVDVYGMYERFMDDVPVLCAVRPSGTSSIEELEDGGGARGILKQLGPLARGDARSVAGKSLAELLEGYTPPTDTIRPLSDPISDRPAIVMVRGNLAPDMAIIKLGLRYDRKLKVTGPAVIFEQPNDAIEGVRTGKVKAGDVVVLRGLGLKGGPGMGMASRLVFAIEGAGLGADVSVVTDGQLSGLVNKGLVVGEVSPEAHGGGPLGLLVEGDMITIDVLARRVDADVSPEEMARRAAALPAPALSDQRGWLSIYERAVGPMDKGATLGPVDS